MGEDHRKLVSAILILSFVSVVLSATDSNDVRILNEIRKGLENPELLKWPDIGNDPCGTPLWPHVYCSGNRVSQIQVQNLGLKGPLPQDFNQLTELLNLGLQRNHFNGKLPTFKGLKKLRFAYLGSNEFDTIPSDFTEGLDALEVLSLENNPLNKTTGWSIPIQLKDAAQLKNLSLSSCNLVGPIPDYLGTMPSLVALKLAYNGLTGGIPETFNQSGLQILWLNNQNSRTGLSGTIDVIAKMTSLAQIWLHGNQFTGTIPADIGNLVSLHDLNLNQNQLSGPIPNSLADKELLNLDLSNNYFMGPIPKFKTANASYKSNAFCQSGPGFPCAPEVTALIDFLGGFNYPTGIASVWKGNNPCGDSWTGLSCSSNGSNLNISIINLPGKNLTGTLRPSVAMLDSLTAIHLQANHITGVIPTELAGLKSLKLLDLSGNNILLPLPKFSSTVKLVIDGNPQLNGNQPPSSPPPGSPSSKNPSDESKDSNGGGHAAKPPSKKPKLLVIVVPLACFAVLVLLAIPLSMYYCKKKKRTAQAPNSYVVHPRDPSDPDDMIKIVVSNNGNVSNVTEGSSQSMHSSVGESHVIESGNLVISVQILRDVTKNFAPENELGRGGFGTVYKGELYDGTKIAVKRMEASMITNKALDEFQSEIAVLTKVRHRHLVSLLGYSIEGNERLLVYEYMPQGALSRHLFQWENFKLEPLSWKRRLNIALDVARGMEYLHTLAHQSFIHRDLKSSNILLGDEFRAKVSDFGLVKLAPDGKRSVVTRLAGTFGYLAPEYAVTGKITTKADVFSFGVVLLELLTGLSALDEDRPEEIRYLAAWFWHVKSNRGKIIAAIDHALEPNEETLESILIVAELAGHCTARDPNQRPDMGHAVNVLSPLVEKWKPFADDPEEYSGIDYSLPLTQMVKGWQESESKDYSYAGLDDSKGSIPQGIADSFNSAR